MTTPEFKNGQAADERVWRLIGTIKDDIPPVPKERHIPRRLSKKELLVLSIEPTVKVKRFCTPDKTRKFEERAAWIYKQYCKERGLIGDIKLKVISSSSGWEMQIYESEKSERQKGGDISNIVKSLEDALQKSGVIKNDKQIVTLIVEKVL
jgi:Holliday junction resolvase RusA-like endonuclease